MSDDLDRLKAALADRYAIEREIGRGGMATVYLAVDLKHHRKVAVKVLGTDVAALLGPDRFLREIELAAGLTHPHILPVHDSGEADGLLYYVMPYVEGESLRNRLQREKQLSVEDALRISLEVADALSYAHSQGVIHRDIKPENILLQSGHAVVADFGIARAIDRAGGDTLTGTGIPVGTPAYMSPEQAVGSKDLDGRSDLYSLGCVLYEMLAGQVPFTGPTAENVVYQHLTAEPRSVTTARPSVAEEVARSIHRALSKSPADRFRTAGEMGGALGTARTSVSAALPNQKRKMPVGSLGLAGIVVLVGTALVVQHVAFRPKEIDGQRIPVLAILPAENLGSAGDETLAAGLVREVQSRLSSLSGLRVVGSISTSSYKDTEKSGIQIGKELGADYVMRFSIQWQTAGSGIRVRVVPELIDARDDTQVWSDTYDGNPGDVFELQSQIAERVIAALGVALMEPEIHILAEQPTDNRAAWEAYLRGVALLDRGATPYVPGASRAAHEAVGAFESAAQIDSMFAMAFAMLSEAHYAVAFNGGDPSDERFDLARKAAERALELSPGLAEAEMALGRVHYRLGRGGDLDLALRWMTPALAQQPNNPIFLYQIAGVLRRRGDWSRAAASCALASDLDPLSLNAAREASLNYLRMRDYDKAELLLDRAVAIRPTGILFARRALLFLMRDGDTEAAVDALRQIPTSGEDLWEYIAINAGAILPRRIAVRVFCTYEPCGQAAQTGRGSLRSKAELQGLLGNHHMEAIYNDSAVVQLMAHMEEQPWDSLQTLASLCLAHAGAGRAHLARQECERLQGMQPLLRDALWGADYLESLAEAYVRIGDYEAAIEQLAIVLSVPSVMSANLLQADPLWDPLREHPRFQALLVKYAEPEVSRQE